jgi:hypothetical protein
MKTTISNYHVRMKIEGIMHELADLKEMVEKLEQIEYSKGQIRFNPTTQCYLEPVSEKWGGYLLKRWPNMEDFKLWWNNHNRKDQIDLYYNITGEKITAIKLEAISLKIYPKVEVIENE